MKHAAIGLAVTTLTMVVIWLIGSYAAADVAWPVSALSWTDPDFRWAVPPAVCRFLIAFCTACVAFIAFVAGAALSAESEQ